MGFILDISHHQLPISIDYDKLEKQLDLVIIRTQYGSKLIDRHYKTHYTEFQKRGVPTAAYAWVRGNNIVDMEQEAVAFYNRTKEFNPTFWFLDVEEESMDDMRNGISAYQKKLRELGAKKVGLYIANHLYADFNIKVEEFDAIWIPSYGKNDGVPRRKPDYPCDIWQYTSLGKLDGFSGGLDLSKLISTKPLSYFTSKVENKPKPSTPVKKPVRNEVEKNKIYVKKFQEWLNDIYDFNIEEDNVFGQKTKKAAIKALQEELNKKYDVALLVDGIFGKRTKLAIRAIEKGDKGRLIRILQGMLYCLGYDPDGFDGLFGKGCEKCVVKFQKEHKIKTDGIAGQITFEEIFKIN